MCITSSWGLGTRGTVGGLILAVVYNLVRIINFVVQQQHKVFLRAFRRKACVCITSSWGLGTRGTVGGLILAVVYITDRIIYFVVQRQNKLFLNQSISENSLHEHHKFLGRLILAVIYKLIKFDTILFQS